MGAPPAFVAQAIWAARAEPGLRPAASARHRALAHRPLPECPVRPAGWPGMSVFTESELEYLASQRLGRIATVGRDGQPHVVPTSFRYNAEQDAIDVGGMRMSRTKKAPDPQRDGLAAIPI